MTCLCVECYSGILLSSDSWYELLQAQRGKLYVGYYVGVKWFFALLIGIGQWISFCLMLLVIYLPCLFQFVDAEVVYMSLIITHSLCISFGFFFFFKGKLASKGTLERKQFKVA